ncbi:MAG: hypothetical protein KBD00_02660 [Candidatus Peribacteraceae bacterium]|nr:hypothetical protein [Candidatus Peribacteraceae bacterium]
MKTALLILLSLVVITVFSLALFIFVRHWKIQNSDLQRSFLMATVPSPLPDGFYAGTVDGWKLSWKGKSFSGITETGINEFSDASGSMQKYPFKTYVTKSVVDPTKEVLRIDYSSRDNPWWVRGVVDEIVEVKPGEYLGKVCLRILPKTSVALGYFHLKK